MNMDELVESTRRQITDPAKTFVQTILAPGGSVRFELGYAPVLADSLVVSVGGVQVPDDQITVDERDGVIILVHPPDKGDPVVVAGLHFRFFTDDELAKICLDAFEMHTKGRSDIYGRVIILGRLDPVEDLPLSILCAIQALYVLLTDASYDIDIYAPDGVNIPRSERFRQLLEMLQLLEARYRDLCMVLGIGLYSVEVLTFRRISKRTNRYVPVYRPQEIDDRSAPKRIKLPIPTYGGKVPDDGIPDLDLDMYRGDSFSQLVKVEWDIPDGSLLRAQIKRYRGAEAVVAEFGAVRVDPRTVLLTMAAGASAQFPETMVWDLQCTYGAGEVKTLLGGSLICHKDITVPRTP